MKAVVALLIESRAQRNETEAMIDIKHRERMLSDFDRTKGVYEDLAMTVGGLLLGILRESDVQVNSVTHRCKERDSLSEKLAKPDKNYSNLADVTDLAGVRITTYFAEDVDRIAEIVEREFDIDHSNSVDKRTLLDPDRFGYQSLHYVASLSAVRTGLVEYTRFAGHRIEIQIRSTLQHAWAEIEHDLGYKSAAGVPRDIRRRFSRIAGLLELADDEFSVIRRELDTYSATVSAEIKSSPEDVGIDKISVQSLAASRDSSLRALSLIVADAAHARLVPSSGDLIERRLDDLRMVNINTIAQLEQAAADKRGLVKAFVGKWLDKKYETLDESIGLLYLIYVAVAETDDRQFVSDFVARSAFQDKQALVGRIVDTYRDAVREVAENVSK